MKKTIIVACIGLLLVNLVTAQTQEEKKTYRFTLKTNPMAALGGPLWAYFVPITGEYKILFEARTTAGQSIETGISYLGPSTLINLDELTSNDSVAGVHTSGYRLQLAYKFFVTGKNSPEGFYIAPHVSFARAVIEDRDDEDNRFVAAKLNVNVLFGYQLISDGGFTLNFFSGFGLKLRDYDFPEGSDFDFDYGNHAVPNVTMGFSFGYAF